MKLNCRQGDLAIIVKSYAGNEGKIVRCLSPWNGGFIMPNGDVIFADGWVIDLLLPVRHGIYARRIQDSQLRPLRDSDGEDEMLRIAGKPEELYNQQP